MVNLVIFLSTAFIAELGLRMFKLPIYGAYHPMIFKDSKIRKHIPNEPYIFKREGYSKGKFNSQGYLDAERSLSKPKGVFRVALIGDSVTEGAQVSLEKRFSVLLEQGLKKVSNQKFEVINFGIGGYATGDEYLLLKQEIMQYSPDLVILSFTAFNDVAGNYSRLDNPKRRFYFELDQKGEILLDDSYYKRYLNSLEGRLRLLLDGKSKVFRMLISLYRDLIVYRTQYISVEEEDGQPLGLPLFHQQLSDNYKKAWRITEQLLFEMKKYVEAKGVKFVLISVPCADQLLPLERWNKLKPKSSPDKPEQILAQICQRQGIRYLDCLPIFLNYSKNEKKIAHFASSPHLNETGHKWVSIILTNYIINNYAKN